METLLLNLSALFALLPASLNAFRRSPARDSVYWSVLAVAIAGPLAWVFIRQASLWHTGLSMALWLTIAGSLVIFLAIAIVSNDGWRLTPILLPYLLLLAVLATIWSQAPERPVSGGIPLAWLGTHIVVSVVTYSLITLAAVAAFAAAIQERALKAKRRTMLSSMLPSMADSESLLVRLLIAGEVVLVLGLLTGIAASYFATGRFVILDHKTIFSFAVFVVVGGLLIAHFRTGIRGRIVVRFVMLAYLLLTLGYPGVKFVTDVLLP